MSTAASRTVDPRYAVVIPTVGRPSLDALLARLGEGDGPSPELVVVVDDRREPGRTPVVDPRAVDPALAAVLVVARSNGRGPAAARNVGWRTVPRDVEWIAFLDDDVLPTPGWRAQLAADLAALAGVPDVAATQGRIEVPLPRDRRPTDWERGTAGLATAWWITADMAYRRAALVEVGGFDERFPRAFREDSDLALRVQDAGHRLVTGDRCTLHPARPAPWWASVRAQRGNADDVLMRRLHGPRWRDRAHDPAARTGRHALTCAAAATALAATVARRPRAALVGAAVWASLTGRFAADRIGPGPRDRREVLAMLATSVAIPPVALRWWSAGWRRPAGPAPVGEPPPPLRAVLFDRDGTLVHDVPYNTDPDRVTPVSGARDAVAAVRDDGLAVGIVTNQSGVARGLITDEQLADVNARIEEIFGPLDTWSICPHGPDDGCTCRKPLAGGVERAAAALEVPPTEVALVGDIGADVEAATAAGARAVLVPNARTRTEEIAAAPLVCADLRTAVAVLRGQSS